MSISEQLIIKCYTNNIKIDYKTTTTILLGCFAVLRLTSDVVYMHTGSAVPEILLGPQNFKWVTQNNQRKKLRG